MRIKNLSFALLAGCFVLAGCNKYVAETDKRIETTLSRVEEYKEMAEIPDLPEPIDTVRVQNDIWLGASSTKIMEGDALPSWVEKEDGITISISEDASLPEIIQEISDMTGGSTSAAATNPRSVETVITPVSTRAVHFAIFFLIVFPPSRFGSIYLFELLFRFICLHSIRG